MAQKSFVRTTKSKLKPTQDRTNVPFLHSCPNPKKVKEIELSQQRDAVAYEQWAARRPSGGHEQSGGTLTREQSLKLRIIDQHNRKAKVKVKIEQVREQMLSPQTPVPLPLPVPPLSKEELRERRLMALGVTS